MINSLNSNHFNLNLQNKNLNHKESNLSKPSSKNFIKELSQESLINSSNKLLNSLNDKTGAVDKILGYSVDKDGFFTSDFNEAVGLPKDYKISATQMQEFIKNLSQNKNFDTINSIKTLANAYEIFSNLMQLSKNELPLGFEMDKNSFVISKIYSNEQDLENNFLSERNSYKANKIIISLKDLKLEDKTFMNFANTIFNQFGGGFVIDGESNIGGKLMGLIKIWIRTKFKP
ncbi:Cj0814 family flagellar-dependent secreted protein [Campylobacter sp. VTCC 70190]|uniref:Cj0814 family flagellar-dependent secreted protein n=1 Tax=Campylobacter sp. VTCC 70190 TaxID=3392118 RepID=UPI00398EDB72